LRPGVCAGLIGRLEPDEWRGDGAVQFVIEDAVMAP